MRNLIFSFSTLLSPFIFTTLSLPTPTEDYSPSSAPSSPCQAAHDSTRATFEIRDFITFQSASTTTTPTHALSFHFSDPQTSVSTLCSRSLSPGDVAAGATLNDPSYYQACNNPAVTFTWDGTRLTVLESWDCGNIFGVLGGHLDFVVSCFAMKPSYARGEGNLCELMADSIVGKYATIWDNTGYFVYGLGPDGAPLE